MTNFIDNNLLVYSVCTITVCLITSFCIKYYFYSTVIETPNSPPTFNLTLDQFKEMQDILDREDLLDQETNDKLDQDFKNILGDENDVDFQSEIEENQHHFNDDFQSIFDIIDLFN
jgi:hypothetical protein